MLKIEEIREIIKLIDQSSIEEFVYEHEGSKVELKKRSSIQTVQEQPVQAPVPSVAVQQPTHHQNKEEERSSAVHSDQFHQIVSPMVGTFYQASSPDTPAYVEVGSEVKEDSIVCIIEAMKLFNEIEAEVEGEIVEILVKDGQLVEYGQPLFLVKQK
ncbi:acetyl-CoA carboxylase biotin carboxyl carrier protein [Lederbergia sp. NSJ-179]|uniref:acetyl-CoA carboxylase biotin carboxyl carrier protein n=1 Tax=Lederbergia sp. NSJ-179 TaxID=2931402 RepID=UPI001FD497CA|nr:acetyl-CoA carboxylase biotin carboxyl carrier protein [Lederbergia sp. NSJ-179]MCJ7839354.1 acetyl-CoA carboxylase biotin carboxyl carrier protein [Lederbergia sp. NSJ-179]